MNEWLDSSMSAIEGVTVIGVVSLAEIELAGMKYLKMRSPEFSYGNAFFHLRLSFHWGTQDIITDLNDYRLYYQSMDMVYTSARFLTTTDREIIRAAIEKWRAGL